MEKVRRPKWVLLCWNKAEGHWDAMLYYLIGELNEMTDVMRATKIPYMTMDITNLPRNGKVMEGTNE